MSRTVPVSALCSCLHGVKYHVPCLTHSKNQACPMKIHLTSAKYWQSNLRFEVRTFLTRDTAFPTQIIKHILIIIISELHLQPASPAAHPICIKIKRTNLHIKQYLKMKGNGKAIKSAREVLFDVTLTHLSSGKYHAIRQCLSYMLQYHSVVA
jgi:hypothetical protein